MSQENPSTLVVLLVPELLGAQADVSTIRETVGTATTPANPVRILMLITPKCDASDQTRHEQLMSFAGKICSVPELNIEVILAHGATNPDPRRVSVQLPESADAVGFALALSDVAMTGTGSQCPQLRKRLEDFGTTIVPVAGPLPRLPTLDSVTANLDPEAAGWRARGRRFFGRLEQVIQRLFEFDLIVTKTGSPKKSALRLWKCFVGWGGPVAYFAQPPAKNASPDKRSFDPASPLVTQFDLFDRSAVYGSSIHRDAIWATHIFATLAVLCAIAGHLFHDISTGANWAELAFLGFVAYIIWLAQSHNLQHRWTACRFGAEQLRIARMCLPVMVLPDALVIRNEAAQGKASSDVYRDGTERALLEVQRAVRDHGLPRFDNAPTPHQAASWVAFVVNDQLKYHKDNAHRLERVESRVIFFVKCAFIFSLLAVFWEIIGHIYHCVTAPNWLLFLTAGGPAFAAALHGAATRLGIVHRISLSKVAEGELSALHRDLCDLQNRMKHKVGDDHWPTVRRLTLNAATAMGRENGSWHGLVRLQRDTLPA